MEPHIPRALGTGLGKMRIKPGTGNLCVGTYSEYLCVMGGEKKRLGGVEGRGVYRGLFSTFNLHSVYTIPKPLWWVNEPCGGIWFFFFGRGRDGGVGEDVFVFLCVFPSSAFCLGKRIEGNVKGELPISEVNGFVGRRRK